MNEIVVSIRLENIRPEGVICVNGDEYENGSYIHCRIPENSPLHVSLTYFGHVFYDQLYDPREDSILLFRAPDTTIITCVHDSRDHYILNGNVINLPFPVTVFDGAHFELTRTRTGESDVTVSIKPTLGICYVTNLFDAAHISTATSISSTPADNPVTRFDVDNTELATNSNQFDYTKSTCNIRTSSDVEQKNSHGSVELIDNRLSGGQERQMSEYHTIRFQNVPSKFSVYIGGNKIVNNEYKFDVQSSTDVRWYEVWHERKPLGRFPLIATSKISTVVTLPDFIWVHGIQKTDVCVQINGNVVDPPCWIPVSDRKSVHVQITSGKNDVVFSKNIQMSGASLTLPDVLALTNQLKHVMPSTSSLDGEYPMARSTLSGLGHSIVGKVVLSLSTIFVTMLYIKYASGAPRILPLALFVLMNTLIWTNSSGDKPTSI